MNPVVLVTSFVGLLHLSLATVQLISGPGNATLSCGGNYTLNCQFSENVNCIWMQSGIFADVRSRYHYVSENGTNTTDCSINITQVREIDTGGWLCKPKISYASVISTLAYLDIEINPGIALDGNNITELLVSTSGIPSGNLSCRVENAPQNAILHWEVDGEHLENSFQNCLSSCCNYCLPWPGDWTQLVNATNVSCNVQLENAKRYNYAITVNATLPVQKTTVIAPNKTTILLNGETITVLQIHKRKPGNLELTCVAENANPAANLHWELDGMPIEGRHSRHVDISEDGYSQTRLLLDWQQAVNATNLSCVAQNSNYIITTAVIIQIHDAKMSTLSIALIATGAIFLAMVIFAACICLLICSKGKAGSQLARQYSMDNWTTNLGDFRPFRNKKTHLPEIPILGYAPEDDSASTEAGYALHSLSSERLPEWSTYDEICLPINACNPEVPCGYASFPGVGKRQSDRDSNNDCSSSSTMTFMEN